MSSQTLPCSTFLPLSTKRNASTVLLRPSPRQHRGIKAMGGEGTDTIDVLQRAETGQQQQNKLSTRVSPVTPIGIWDRFPRARTVQQMLETMERIMEDPFGFPFSLIEETGSPYRRGRTPWEIVEGESEYKMRFDIPGMTKEDVKVSVEDKLLVVRAEKVVKSSEGEQEEGGDQLSAKSYGMYSTRIALPENAEVEQIKAEVKDGVLYITVPKAKKDRNVLDISVE